MTEDGAVVFVFIFCWFDEIIFFFAWIQKIRYLTLVSSWVFNKRVDNARIAWRKKSLFRGWCCWISSILKLFFIDSRIKKVKLENSRLPESFDRICVIWDYCFISNAFHTQLKHSIMLLLLFHLYFLQIRGNLIAFLFFNFEFLFFAFLNEFFALNELFIWKIAHEFFNLHVWILAFSQCFAKAFWSFGIQFHVCVRILWRIFRLRVASWTFSQNLMSCFINLFALMIEIFFKMWALFI